MAERTPYHSIQYMQWSTYNFWAPGKHSLHSLITVLIHNSGHFGPPLPFWAPLPMASYVTEYITQCIRFITLPTMQRE